MGKIITLCGSHQFEQAFKRVAKSLTLEGHIVLMPHVFDNMETDTAAMLTNLQQKMIDMSDSIFVINVGGYIGSSTKSEIAYAKSHNKTVEYLERDTAHNGSYKYQCPRCGGHRFTATAHITQGWEIDGDAEFTKVTEDCIETTHSPDEDDLWECLCCGYDNPGREFRCSQQQASPAPITAGHPARQKTACYVLSGRCYSGENSISAWYEEQAAHKAMLEEMQVEIANLQNSGYNAVSSENGTSCEIHVPDSDIYYEWEIEETDIQ